MKPIIKNSYLTLVYGFLYAPIIVVVLFSFNNSTFSLLWHGFSTKWYHTLFHDSDLAIVALHSLTLGVCAATIGTFIGLLASVALFRYQFFGKRSLDMLLLMLIIIPDIVMGVALLLLFKLTGITLGFWTLLIAHISFCVPFSAVTISSRLVGFNEHLIEASRDLGANESTIFKRILIPLLWPSIIAAWLLCFTLSIDDVVISYFVSGPGFQILPLKIFSMVKLGVKPEINALCSVLLIITLTTVLISQLLIRKRS